MDLDIYECCECCGSNTMHIITLPTGAKICGHCYDNTYQCDECCEHFDGTEDDYCPSCGSNKIFKAVEG
ncbi:MAG: hypothetical protein JSV83_00175 [Desulfobacterales bacterium]|nr:MAG: hypothetical protein JSV83_00175 [Desulfobacterales bacterium]